MNREIKFRAWDKDDEEMHEDVTPMYRDGELENIIFDYENAGYDFVDIEIKYCDAVLLYENNPYIIMQYTGLKDKNGTEIYEGDIIENISDDAHEIVTFDEGSFWLEGSTYTSPLHEVNTKDEEIIGNIHEHSHLLEGVDE